jgi:hypothetical protein
MGTPIDQHLGTGKADESQIPDQVQELMAHRFIIKPQGGIEPVVTITAIGTGI